MQYPFVRPTYQGFIQDIQDGNRYRKLSRPGKFLSVPEHTGLILCADGVPLFASSGTLCNSLSLPEQCVITLNNIILQDSRYGLFLFVSQVCPLKSG